MQKLNFNASNVNTQALLLQNKSKCTSTNTSVYNFATKKRVLLQLHTHNVAKNNYKKHAMLKLQNAQVMLMHNAQLLNIALNFAKQHNNCTSTIHMQDFLYYSAHATQRALFNKNCAALNSLVFALFNNNIAKLSCEEVSANYNSINLQYVIAC